MYNSEAGADEVRREARVVAGLDGLPQAAHEEFHNGTKNNYLRSC